MIHKLTWAVLHNDGQVGQWEVSQSNAVYSGV